MAIATVFDAQRQKLLADQAADTSHVGALRLRIERLERLVGTLEQDKVLLLRELEGLRGHRQPASSVRHSHSKPTAHKRRQTAAA